MTVLITIIILNLALRIFDSLTLNIYKINALVIKKIFNSIKINKTLKF